MTTLWMLLVLPLLSPFIIKMIFNRGFNFQEMMVTMVTTSLIVLAVFEISKVGKTIDFEIWNGYVTDKKMVQKNCPSGWVSYTDNFCSEYRTRRVKVGETCTTDSNGHRSCTPIYKTEYNYDYPWERRWYVYTTLENFQISRIDRQGAKKPPRWEEVKKNDPASVERRFKNYIKAVPESLFNNESVSNNFAGKIPAYPEVYDYYKIKRVIPVGVPNNDLIRDLNRELSTKLNILGAQKQVNVNVVITSITDSSYRYALEREWLGGKKNDVTLILGISTLDGSIDWVDAFTWGGTHYNGIFVSSLKTEITNIGYFNRESLKKIAESIESSIRSHYDRPSESEFAYLEDSIEPSTGAIIFSVVLQILLLIGFGYFFNQIDFDPIGEMIRSFRNSRRY